MALAWSDAAEDAADDAATAGEALARVELAALLLKVARLASGSTWSTVAVSPFVDADGLGRRVRRLLERDQPLPSSPWANLLPLAATGLVAAVLAGLNSPATLERVHEVVESVITFAR